MAKTSDSEIEYVMIFAGWFIPPASGYAGGPRVTSVAKCPKEDAKEQVERAKRILEEREFLGITIYKHVWDPDLSLHDRIASLLKKEVMKKVPEKYLTYQEDTTKEVSYERTNSAADVPF